MDGITVKGLPLTGAQRNVWFHQQLDPNEPAYNTGNYIELEGDIDVARLDRAQKRLYEETDVLRLGFHDIDGEPYQVVMAIPASDLRVWELRDEDDAELRASQILEEEHYRLFDLERGPLYRCGLIRVSEKRWIWFWYFHHLLGLTSTFLKRPGWLLHVKDPRVLKFQQKLKEISQHEMIQLF